MHSRNWDVSEIQSELSYKGIKLQHRTVLGEISTREVVIPKDAIVGLKTWAKIDFICKVLGIDYRRSDK